MKYYSEILNKVFDTEKACYDAELECKRAEEAKLREIEQKKLAEKKKQEERAADAKIVEQKREAMIQAQKDYYDAIDAFTKKHGSYHFSTNSADEIPHLFGSLFDFLG